MIRTITVDEADRMLILPEKVETGNQYRLVGPDGEAWPVVFDIIKESWVTLPF